jgi:hypothetical protein
MSWVYKKYKIKYLHLNKFYNFPHTVNILVQKWPSPQDIRLLHNFLWVHKNILYLYNLNNHFHQHLNKLNMTRDKIDIPLNLHSLKYPRNIQKRKNFIHLKNLKSPKNTLSYKNCKQNQNYKSNIQKDKIHKLKSQKLKKNKSLRGITKHIFTRIKKHLVSILYILKQSQQNILSKEKYKFHINQLKY